MTSSEPTIVLIPGAWHKPTYFSALRDDLENHGYPTISHKLPSMDCTDASEHTAQTDANFIRTQLLLPLLDEGRRVIVAMHNYGGVTDSAAMYGLSEEETHEEGLPGGVVGLVYIAAFIIPTGSTCSDMNPPPLAELSVAEDGISTMTPAGAIPNFYNDLQPPQHSTPLGRTDLINVDQCPLYPGNSHSARTTRVQRANQMVAKAGIDKVATLETDHSPFLTMPEKTAEIMMEHIESFK